MAKDTRNIANAGAAKEGLKKISQRADEVIVEQSKDASNADIQAGNEKRMEGLPSSVSTPKDDPALPDPLRKPNIEPLDPTKGQDARAAAQNVGTGRVTKTTVLDFGKLPSRPEGGAAAASVNVTEKPEVIENLAKRQVSDMGIPGSENGILDLALSLHRRDHDIAKQTGKVVNDVHPTDSPVTEYGQIYGGHHHRLAKVMHTFGIADEEVYKNAAAQTDQRLQTYVHGLHKIAQEHEDSKRLITHTPGEGALWEHPSTKELIPVAANHPDMPSAFTRTKGKVARVTRDASGAEVVKRSHEGWDSFKVAGGKTVFRQYKAEPGIDLVDHMRVQLLSEHGPSKTSRKRGGDIATEIANTVSGVVPRGMKKIGTRKVAKGTTPRVTSRPKAVTRPHGSSTQPADKRYRLSPDNVEGTEPLLVPKPPKRPKGPRAYDAPYPPGVRGLTSSKAGKETSAIADQKYLVGIKPPTDLPTFTSGGTKASQPMLPGTGVPKPIVEQVSPAKYQRLEGPLSKGQTEKIGQKASKQSKPWTEEEMAPRIKVADEVNRISGYEPTDRDWKPENPNRGQQFAIDTTDMTGAQEVKAIAAQGGLASQKAAGKSLVVRPGGRAQAKRDRQAKPEPEQLDLFPGFEVKESRKNAFYMAGGVQQASEETTTLQSVSKQPFGKQPNNKDFETEDSADSILDRLKVGSKKKAD